MVDQNLLIFFIALTTLAVLIQTGIATGLFIASLKMSQQADRAVVQIGRLLDPLHRMVDSIENVSVRVSEFSASSQGTLRQVEARWDEALQRFRRKIA